MYFNYKRFSVNYQAEENSFQVLYRAGDDVTETVILDLAQIAWANFDDEPLTFSDFGKPVTDYVQQTDAVIYKITYPDGPVKTPEINLIFTLNSQGLRCRFQGRARFTVNGVINWGNDAAESTFAVCEDLLDSGTLHAASGPAVPDSADALFDRTGDRLLKIDSEGDLSFAYDWPGKQYHLHYRSGLDFGRELFFNVREDYLKNKLNVPYAPIDKSHGFTVPPVGWMTWYAVRFAASNQVVLANAAKLKQYFGDYSDKLVLWVDWEWCHRNFEGTGEAGADIFHPRKIPYPDGLAPVAAAIKNLGLLPALWIGATNEGQLNDDLIKHPEWLMGQQPFWCGQYWVDPSHPGVVEEYIPKIFRQVLDWGYQLIKWDCLPATLYMACKFHDKFHNPALSPATALRNVVAAARQTVGEETYMLSCAGDTERDITGMMDYFSAARIGGDIFGWEEFLDQAIGRVLHFYTLHNITLYNDADNLVLRSEFNNLAQARSRVSFYGLSGLPVTIGDSFDELDLERINLLRRIVPPVPARPVELRRKQRNQTWQIVNLKLCRPFGVWHAAGVTNLSSESSTVQLDFAANLDLTAKTGTRFAVFEFWSQRFLGTHDKHIKLHINGFDTAVLRVTPVTPDAPTLVGSSRHVTQGGVEINDFAYDFASKTLSGEAVCAAEEILTLTILLPEGFAVTSATVSYHREDNLLKLELTGSQEQPTRWSVSF